MVIQELIDFHLFSYPVKFSEVGVKKLLEALVPEAEEFPAEVFHLGGQEEFLEPVRVREEARPVRRLQAAVPSLGRFEKAA